MNVNVNNVMKTPQFWLLFTTSTLLCTGGMGLLSVAKPMISDVFTAAMPMVVTASFASSYLMAMAGGNLAGRLVWAAVSDKIGRRNTFHIFTLGAVPIFASVPFCVSQVGSFVYVLSRVSITVDLFYILRSHVINFFLILWHWLKRTLSGQESDKSG
jgi:MFS family permease